MMQRAILIILLSIALAACGSSGENLEKLHGKWQIDKAASVKMHQEFGKMSKPMQDEMQSRMPPMKFEFDALGKGLLINIENQKEKCIFTVEKDKGDMIMLSCGDIQFDITFVNDKQIILRQARVKDKTALVLNKSK